MNTITALLQLSSKQTSKLIDNWFHHGRRTNHPGSMLQRSLAAMHVACKNRARATSTHLANGRRRGWPTCAKRRRLPGLTNPGGEAVGGGGGEGCRTTALSQQAQPEMIQPHKHAHVKHRDIQRRKIGLRLHKEKTPDTNVQGSWPCLLREGNQPRCIHLKNTGSSLFVCLPLSG